MKAGRVDVTRSVAVPDMIAVERCARLPELGPRILFFSGGSALRPICRVLKHYTHNSIHLITPFDSGGSSAELRAAFSMPAVGDLRSRLMALADESTQGNPATYALFSHRLASDRSGDELRAELRSMISGQHALVSRIPGPLRRIVRSHLETFADRMPDDFDLRHASVGNLLLAGGYLANDRNMDSVVFSFSNLVEARGLVRLIVDDDVTLYARTSDGRTTVGQHAITGRSESDDSAFTDLWLGDADCQIEPHIEALIWEADLICFPMGSFFTSVLANLLPRGVGRAIAEARCPKIYIPNTGADPEQRGISVADAIDHIARLVRKDAGAEVPMERVLGFVLIDSERGRYQTPCSVDDIASRGIQVLDRPIVCQDHPDQLEPDAVSQILLSLG